MVLVHVKGYSRIQRKVTAEITATQSDLAGCVSCNWKKKNVFRSKAQEVDDKLVSLSVTVWCVSK